MKFKLDENFSRRAVEPLKQAGHDILTVTDENLAGADDATVLTVARAEGRCLITLDLEFANPLLFNPSLRIQGHCGRQAATEAVSPGRGTGDGDAGACINDGKRGVRVVKPSMCSPDIEQLLATR